MTSPITDSMLHVVPKSFVPEKAEGVDTVVQYKFTGSDTSEWYLIVKDKTLTIEQGVHPNPNMTMTFDADAYLKIANGELDPTMAFMRGKVKVSGDMKVALKMGQFFKYGKDK